MRYKDAREIAVNICTKLQPFTVPDRLRIAGSIRRKKAEVHDIEIVCLPSLVIQEQPDLFGSINTSFSIHPEFKSVAEGLGKVIKGKPTGRMMQIELFNKEMLDLFIPQPHDYFRQLAIRTGSSTYSNMVIAYGWKKLGWVGTDEGLRRQSECKEFPLAGHKSKWICNVNNPTLPPVWKSEEEFFEWLQVPFVSPENRNI